MRQEINMLCLLMIINLVISSFSCIRNFEELVPRLWPFLSHNSSGVRKSVLEALITLTSSVVCTKFCLNIYYVLALCFIYIICITFFFNKYLFICIEIYFWVIFYVVICVNSYSFFRHV